MTSVTEENGDLIIKNQVYTEPQAEIRIHENPEDSKVEIHAGGYWFHLDKEMAGKVGKKLNAFAGISGKQAEYMNDNEKLLLLQLILEDIRGNWGFENEKAERQPYALKLAKELAHIPGMPMLISTINGYFTGEDGRYFRDNYPYGYYDMAPLHGLPKSIIGRSKEFQRESMKYLTYPENRFDDYEFRLDEGE